MEPNGKDINAGIDIASLKEEIGTLIKKQGARLSYEKIAYSRSKNAYVLFLDCSELLSIKESVKLKKTFEEALHNFVAVVRQPGEELLRAPLLLEKTVKEYIIYEEPALLPFIKQCTVKLEGSFLSLVFKRELGPHMAKKMGLKQKLESFLLDNYGLSLILKEFAAGDVEETGEVELSGLFQEREPLKEPEPGSALPIRKSEKAEKKPRYPGKKKAALTAVSTISELVPDGEAHIEGEILAFETFSTKENKYLIAKLVMTDYTSSVRCQKFIKGGQTHKVLNFKKGDYVSIYGRYVFDSFNKEYIINLQDIEPANKPVRMDTAKEKRVELHLHTNMSAQDGMAPAGAYIERAAKWGHEAIAITDHGVVQAFPDASAAGKQNPGVKVLYGVEAYMVDVPKKIYGGKDRAFSDTFVVFDIETTGMSQSLSEIIEIGAVRVEKGRITGEFNTFARPKLSVPYEITKLTGISQDMVQDAPEIEEAIRAFWEFAEQDCLVAHNAPFDTGFVFVKSRQMGMQIHADVLDTLLVARAYLKQLKSRSLDKLAEHYSIPLVHHRAVNDARCTAEVMLGMFSDIEKEHGYTRLSELNYLADTFSLVRSAPRPNHIILLCKNKTGLVNLYKLISISHLDYFYGRPRMPKSELFKYREGLIFGSACEQGELYQAVLLGLPEERIEEIAAFYDYLEIQPFGNNEFMVRNGTVGSREALDAINKKIYALGKKLDKPVVATGDVHFLEERDEYFRRILMETSGFKDADNQAPLYFKTTDEMLEEFSYLGQEAAYEVVVKNPKAIANSMEAIDLFPGETAMPVVKEASGEIREAAVKNMHLLYGDPLPDHIQARLFKELNAIVDNGFSVLYWIAMKLVNQSVKDGYIVGSRGSVGSSLAAFAMGITEVNPLHPHYRCPNCQHSDFAIDKKYGCGPDMPEAFCPLCGAKYEADGYDIPFEVFLGLNAEKVPDIDLNFSGDYRPIANKYIEELFGEEYVYRAGTINSIQENTAKGLVRKYMEQTGKTVSEVEIERLAAGMTGVKKTTGQHPGGLVIVPKDREIYEFTPIQRPADKSEAGTITTHFDFNSMHDILIKLDILGHDNPTVLKILQDATGIDPLCIPLSDEKTLSLFTGTEALQIHPDQIRGVKFGTLGIPEFGTPATMRILEVTRPRTVAELIRISGLSHGTNVWKGNAEDLVLKGTVSLSGAICTRDDIMLGLLAMGVPHQTAFFIMESVRKGNWAMGREKKQAEQEKAMREASVPEWFIDSCKKIEYMFPKAHAAAYVVMALRIAYFKVHHPLEFYAAIFSIKVADFNAGIIMKGKAALGEELERLSALGMKQTATEKSAGVALDLALEMMERGFFFMPPDIRRSKAARFMVEEGKVRMPFMSIPSLGAKAAEQLERKAMEMEFTSVEELKKECRLSQKVVDTMRELGCLNELPEKAQLSLFDALCF